MVLLLQLEFINDEIWANIWMTECIAKIDPRTGKVRSVLSKVACIAVNG